MRGRRCAWAWKWWQSTSLALGHARGARGRQISRQRELDSFNKAPTKGGLVKRGLVKGGLNILLSFCRLVQHKSAFCRQSVSMRPWGKADLPRSLLKTAWTPFDRSVWNQTKRLGVLNPGLRKRSPFMHFTLLLHSKEESKQVSSKVT